LDKHENKPLELDELFYHFNLLNAESIIINLKTIEESLKNDIKKEEGVYTCILLSKKVIKTIVTLFELIKLRQTIESDSIRDIFQERRGTMLGGSRKSKKLNRKSRRI
jgi:hypothetical protein